MAIPFTPNEDTDEYYRVLAQLLRDVIEVLNLLVRRPPPPPPRNRSAVVNNTEEDRTAPLPDLVQCAMTPVERLGATTATIAERLEDCPFLRPRPGADVVLRTPIPSRTTRPRRRHVRNPSRSENWSQIGEELKMIADAFTDTTREAQTSTEELDEDKKQQASLLSLLMPPHLSSSVWTAVIFFVGWRLLSGRGR